MKSLLFVLALLCTRLVACARPTQTPVIPEETPLLTDADIDNNAAMIGNTIVVGHLAKTTILTVTARTNLLLVPPTSSEKTKVERIPGGS
jgi:hypothetical protein